MMNLKFLPMILFLILSAYAHGQETVLDFYVPTNGSTKYFSFCNSDKMSLEIGYRDNGPVHQKIEASCINGRVLSSIAKLYQEEDNKIYITNVNIESITGNITKSFGSRMIELILPPNPTANVSWKTIDQHEDPISCVASFEDLNFNGRTIKTIKVVKTQMVGSKAMKSILYYGYHLGYIREDVVGENGKVNTIILMDE